MKVMADYFKAIFTPDPKSKKQEDKNVELEDTLKTADGASPPKLTKQETADGASPPKLTKQDTLTTSKKRDQKKQTKLPKLKANVSIKDFRVAIIENVDTPHPQALVLKVCIVTNCLWNSYISISLSHCDKLNHVIIMVWLYCSTVTVVYLVLCSIAAMFCK